MDRQIRTWPDWRDTLARRHYRRANHGSGKHAVTEPAGLFADGLLEYDGCAMRRLFHSALSIWFLIVMTMAQGCAGPAQNSGYSAHDANSAGTKQSQFSRANNGQFGFVDTKNYVADTSASSALTDHLKQHRLPLVGAQVLRNPNDGSRAVVLYGFVGSDLGKSDAQRQAEDYINDASVEVDNRIRVNPDLLSARGSSSATPPDASNDPDAQANANASMPGVQSYVDQQNQTAQVQQYQQQNSMGASMSTMLPLIALMGLLSMSSGGGSFSTGPPMGYSPYGYPSSPYGNSPYSPYSGYAPSMPPSSFGNPGYGYGSPGGVTPFGSLPGSPYSAMP